MWCHLLLALPVLGLGLFLVLPPPIALPLYLLVDLFSLWLYRRIMAAMRQPVQVGVESLLGAKVEVLQPLTPQTLGLVRVGGEVWRARSIQPMAPGTPAHVVGLEGLSMLVEAESGA